LFFYIFSSAPPAQLRFGKLKVTNIAVNGWIERIEKIEPRGGNENLLNPFNRSGGTCCNDVKCKM
jgi:hypothetical protein